MVKYGTNESSAIWWANLQLMQLAPSGGQIWNRCKWRYLVDNFVTYASGAIGWQTSQLAQVVSSGGQKAFQGNVTMQMTRNVTQ